MYVHAAYRRRGLAKELMQRLLERARAQTLHVMVGVIDASNQASIDLHIQMGFTHAGTLRQAGFKFGRWLDVDFYQQILSEDAPLSD